MTEYVLQGESALTLDPKGRVAVPARYREALAALCQGQMTVTKQPQKPNQPERGLLLFPRPVWVGFRSKLLALPMEAEGWRRIYMGSAMDVDIDAGSRVLISLELRTWAGLGEKLMMVGMGNRLEIWDHGRYQALEDATLAQPVPESLASLVF